MPKSDTESTTTTDIPKTQSAREPDLSTVSEEVAVSENNADGHSEVRRKILHMSPGIAPFVLALTPHGPTLEIKDLIAVSIIIVIFILLFLKSRKHVERKGETNLLSTVFTYAGVVAAVLFLFRDHSEFAAVVTVIIAFGDSAAHIGGKLLGKTKLPWNKDKSWMGMLCFVLFSAPFAALAFYMEANPKTSIQIALVCGFTASIAGCLAETIDTKLTDNLRVGVAAAVGVAASFYTFQGYLA